MNKLCTNLMNKYVNSYQIKIKNDLCFSVGKKPELEFYANEFCVVHKKPQISAGIATSQSCNIFVELATKARK